MGGRGLATRVSRAFDHDTVSLSAWQDCQFGTSWPPLRSGWRMVRDRLSWTVTCKALGGGIAGRSTL